MVERIPTKQDLVAVICHLQMLIGQTAAAANDRNPNRAADIARYTNEAQELCIEATGFFPPEYGDKSRFRFAAPSPETKP